MGAEILLDDDATPATGLVFSAAAGDTSTAQVFHVWYNKGTPGGAAANVRIHAAVENPPGTWNISGETALTEHWLEARINGGDNTALVAGMVLSATDWFRLGDGVFLPVPDIPGNTARFLEVRLHPPLKDGIATEAVTFRLYVVHGDNTFGVSSGITEEGFGILTGVGDRTVREFVEAPAVTASGSPDAIVHVSRCWFVYDGIPYRTISVTDLTLNQNDGAAAALTAGQAYKALISQPPGNGTTEVAPVATKGIKAVAASAAVPACPAGNLPVAVVTVSYQVGGTSIISTANISSVCYGSRYAVSGVGTPNLTIQPGRALLKGTFLRDTLPQTFPSTISATHFFWLTTSGTVVETATSTPATAGDLPLCSVTRGGGSNITAIADFRTFREPLLHRVRLAVAGNVGTGTNVARARVDFPFVIDRVTFGVRAPSTGATGATTGDVNVGGGSIYGTPPSIAAQGNADDSSYPVVTVSAAAWLSLDLDAATSGGTAPVDAEAVVYVYPVARAS